MARCYELDAQQSRLWTEGDGWDTWRIEETVLEWADTNRMRDEIIVVTAAHQIAFALTAPKR
jgi:hypothetical protein